MRDALKNLFCNQITLADNSRFNYTVKPYELTNALGTVIAVLQEYHLTTKDNNTQQFSCKLYKTKEGNWYDFDDAERTVEKGTLRLLKSAIDIKEKAVFQSDQL